MTIASFIASFIKDKDCITPGGCQSDSIAQRMKAYLLNEDL